MVVKVAPPLLTGSVPITAPLAMKFTSPVASVAVLPPELIVSVNVTGVCVSCGLTGDAVKVFVVALPGGGGMGRPVPWRLSVVLLLVLPAT